MLAVARSLWHTRVSVFAIGVPTPDVHFLRAGTPCPVFSLPKGREL